MAAHGINKLKVYYTQVRFVVLLWCLHHIARWLTLNGFCVFFSKSTLTDTIIFQAAAPRILMQTLACATKQVKLQFRVHGVFSRFWAKRKHAKNYSR